MKLIRIVPNKSAVRAGSRERGATMVEFAMTFLVVTFVLFLLVEFALWIHCYNTLADAAKAGVRYAVVHGSGTSNSPSGPSCTSGCAPVTTCTTDSTNVAAVKAEVQKWAAFSIYGTTTSTMTVTVCYMDGSNTPPSRVRVQVSNSVSPFFSIFGGTPPVTAAAQGRIVN
jgi:Flp pilus assembly protein TadG